MNKEATNYAGELGKAKRSISSLPLGKLQQEIKELGQPAFRAKQLYQWLHQKQAASFDEMSNLSKDFRQRLEQEYTIDVPEVELKLVSTDGTRKYLLKLADGNCVEAVLMHYSTGNTLCVSSQVGCRMGCRFCASTKPLPGRANGLVRNLTAGEIAGEVYTVMRESGESVTRVVMMGIGEPLDNLDNVLDFVAIITSPEGYDLSGRHITISTCGVVPAIRKMAEYKLPLTLSISLHGATNAVRSGMMPVNDAFPLEELIDVCRQYQTITGRRVSYEYAMVRGTNDSPEDAKRLAALLGKGAHVNLIPINPVDGLPYGASDEKNVVAFQKRLEQLSLNATIRRRLGVDIDAACGQLRLRTAAGEEKE